MATMYTPRIIYANESAEEHGVIVAILNTQRDSNEEQFEIIQSTTLYKTKYTYHGKYKTSPSSFKLSFFNEDGTMIDSYKQEELKKWLIRDSFNWLSGDQDDLYDKNYRCIMYNPSYEDVGMQNAGYVFNVLLDSPYAWSNLKTKNYSSTSSLTFKFINTAMFDKYILSPQLTLTCTSNGNISIKNNTYNKIMTINNCTSGEILYFDCEEELPRSSTGRNLLSDFNKYFLELGSGENSITLTGSFNMKMQYRIPARIGG